MDLVLGQAPAIAAASSAAEAAGSATQAAASAAQAAANAASIGFTAGDSVVNDAGQLEMALPSIFKSANYSVAAQDRGKVLACTAGGITITLPAWTAVGNGFVVGIRNNVVGTGSITLLAAAGELIEVDLLSRKRPQAERRHRRWYRALSLLAAAIEWRRLGAP